MLKKQLLHSRQSLLDVALSKTKQKALSHWGKSNSANLKNNYI